MRSSLSLYDPYPYIPMDEVVINNISGVRYQCNRCAVWGVANHGEAYVCWCCGQGDQLGPQKGTLSPNVYNGNFTAAIGPGPGRIDDN